VKRILIFGVTGQDGSFAADFFLKKKFKVFGLVRKSATGNLQNIQHLLIKKNFEVIHGDLLDPISLRNAIIYSKPNEIYNYADQDHVRWSFEIPLYSYSVTSSSLINIFEILKEFKHIKFLHPISSNIFGQSKKNKQNEKSTINPQSIYSLAKASALITSNLYRNVFKLKIYNPIFFNHESERRPDEYVSRKITKTAVQIYLGKKKNIFLGDINAKIDWGYAPDYVEAAYKLMQLNKPDVMCIGSGKLTSIKKFLEITFKILGMNYRKYLKIDQKLIRPSKNSPLIADISKAKKLIKFKPSTSLRQMIEIMVQNDLKHEKEKN